MVLVISYFPKLLWTFSLAIFQHSGVFRALLSMTVVKAEIHWEQFQNVWRYNKAIPRLLRICFAFYFLI